MPLINAPSSRRKSNRRGPFKAPPHPCTLCGKICPGRRSRCMSCTTRIRRYRVKAAAVALLGGVTKCCGWSGDLAGYAFHHPDDNKEFEIGDLKHKSWPAIKEEVLKCELWCCRCHAIHHSSYRDPAFMAAVRDYRGTSLEEWIAEGGEANGQGRNRTADT